MSVLDLFWLFFMLSAVQPLLRQRMMEAMRTRKIAQFERARNSRVILLVHRQETMKFLGFPVMRYIDVNDSEEVLRAIRLTDDEVPLDIVLQQPRQSLENAIQLLQETGSAVVGVVDSAGRLVGLITPENIGGIMMLHAAQPRRPTAGPRQQTITSPWMP